MGHIPKDTRKFYMKYLKSSRLGSGLMRDFNVLFQHFGFPSIYSGLSDFVYKKK